MNRPGYPTSYQHISGFASQPYISTPTSASPSPLGWTAPSRQTSRPCRCGRGRCRWLFSYHDKMMIAIHELLPANQIQEPHTTTLKPLRKLSVAQKATFMASQNGLEVSFLKTFSIPVFRRCQDNAEQMRHFLEHEPWLDVNRIEKDKVVCLGCGCDVLLGSIVYEPGNWMHNRDECVGIESAILDSVLNTWEVKSAKSLAVNS